MQLDRGWKFERTCEREGVSQKERNTRRRAIESARAAESREEGAQLRISAVTYLALMRLPVPRASLKKPPTMWWFT